LGEGEGNNGTWFIDGLPRSVEMSYAQPSMLVIEIWRRKLLKYIGR